MEALLLLIMGAVSVACFVIGAKVGQTVSKGETVKLPDLNPINAIRERKDKEQAQWEQDRLDTIMRNIEGYDGTSRGQEDVPRG